MKKEDILVNSSGLKLSTVPFIALLLLFACANISSQYGGFFYWALALLFSALFLLPQIGKAPKEGGFDLKILRSKSCKYFIFGSALFVLWIAINALIHPETLYLSVKYVLKYLVMTSMVIAFSLSSLNAEFLLKAMANALILFFISLLVIFNIPALSDMIIVFPSPRIGLGLSIALPGVFYKLSMYMAVACIFLYGYSLKKKYLFIALMAGIIINFDGSRTALLWLMIGPILAFILGYFYRLKQVNKGYFLLPILALWLAMWVPTSLKTVFLTNLSSHPQYSQADDLAQQKTTDKSSKAFQRYAPTALKRSVDDPIRPTMLSVGLHRSIDEFPFGGGLGSTKVEFPKGKQMVVHNLYLQLLGDLGIIGFIAYALIFSPLLFAMRHLYKQGHLIDDGQKIAVLGVMGIILCYLFKSLLHPISNDLTDLGFILLAMATLIRWNALHESFDQ